MYDPRPFLTCFSSEAAASELKQVKNGLGSYIVSTNQGLMTDKDAKSKNIGGEILCEVF